ncbi:hypothetical protein DRQ33_02015 [bacterium]|mgnify:CR=1 FL=1|nr:MAG: hypothetical protein DRQ33_02015 [bacterium]
MNNIKEHNREGITLSEILVAMILIGLLMTTTFYVFSTFFARSLAYERQALSQADTQLGVHFLKWDLFMTGYGIPTNVIPISSSDNTGENGSDVLTLQSVAFGSSGNPGRWSYMLSPVEGTNQIIVRRWNDAEQDIVINDNIAILSPTKGQVGFSVYTVTDTTAAIGPSGQPATILTLDNIIQSAINFVFVVGPSGGPVSVNYSISNGNLMRDTSLFMTDVANFQITFWIDSNGNRQIDAGEMHNDLSAVTANPSLLDNIKLIRLSIVTATREEENYIYPQDTIIVGNQTIDVENLGRNFRYSVWENTIKPRNL